MAKKTWMIMLILLLMISCANRRDTLDESADRKLDENTSVTSGELMENESLLDVPETGEPQEDAGYDFDIEFSLSCIKLPDILLWANASFSIGYTIHLNKDCHPSSAYLIAFDKSVSNAIKGVLDSEEVISCIKKWKFVGLDPRSTYTVLLRWEHMKGWVTMLIYSENLNLQIRLLPD